MKIQLKVNARQSAVPVDIEPQTSLEELVALWQDKLPYQVVAAKVDNRVKDLTVKIDKPCLVEFLDLSTREGNLIFQHSLTFLYLKAVEEVVGRRQIKIKHSLNQGLYTEIGTGEIFTPVELTAIRERMDQLVAQDLPFQRRWEAKEAAMSRLDSLGLGDKRRILEHLPIKNVTYYELEGFVNFFYGHMTPSTGYIKPFELRPYKRGVLLRFPQGAHPVDIPPYQDQSKLFEAFETTEEWERLLGIEYVADLNEKIQQGEMKDIILLAEALHEQRIVELAREITEKKKRIVLIAGPSSSGKTSFAKRLCIQLRVKGQKPLYLGTDDYFLDRTETPLDEHGEPDFENLQALDIELFNSDMNRLLAGEEVDLPTFDFREGKKEFGKRITKIQENQPIVIEGIHGLNETLTSKISPDEKFKIYISPLTQLNIDAHDRIPTTDTRMIRRMVRDYKYRDHSAEDTIREWPKVRAGEDKNIFPYSGEADAFFNTALVYELAVLKKYARPLLEAISPDQQEYAEAERLLRFLSFFKTYEEEDSIVNNSILREFIGGSVFVEE